MELMKISQPVLYVLAFIMPLIVYVYYKNSKHGLVINSISIALCLIGLELLYSAFYNIGSSTMLLLIYGMCLVFGSFIIQTVDVIYLIHNRNKQTNWIDQT